MPGRKGSGGPTVAALLLAAAAFAVTISAYNREVMVRECGAWARDKIHVVHCGVDPEVFVPRAEPEEASIPHAEPRAASRSSAPSAHLCSVRDAWGLTITTQRPDAALAYGGAVLSLLGHCADTLQHVDEALEADPELLLGHVIRGFALRLLARRGLRVLAIDGDSNPNLALTLGVPSAQWGSVPTLPRDLARRGENGVELTKSVEDVRASHSLTGPDGTTLLVMLVLLALSALYLFITEQDDIGTGTYALEHALLFVGLNLPKYAFDMLPIAALIGALLALGNLDPCIHFAVLSDFVDAPAREMPLDGAILAAARDRPDRVLEHSLCFALIEIGGQVRRQLEQLGVEVPETWDEFIAALDRIKAQGVQPFAVGGADLPADVVHVEAADGLDHLVERRRRQGAHDALRSRVGRWVS